MARLIFQLLKTNFKSITLGKCRRHRWRHWRRFVFFSILGIFLFSFLSSARAEDNLPLAQVHPLPTFLAQWQETESVDDYFSQIKPSPVGYLIWSRFPVKVYLQKPPTIPDHSASLVRFQDWFKAMEKGIGEWGEYLPISQVEEPEIADIIIERAFPPLEAKINPETGLFDLPRARAAQTHYHFYLSADASPLLLHRMTIQISPNLSQKSARAAIRHEFGHALGIWGHSDLETDALYFSQVRYPPKISVRDINTLKKIYQQPTRLGWQIVR